MLSCLGLDLLHIENLDLLTSDWMLRFFLGRRRFAAHKVFKTAKEELLGFPVAVPPSP